MKDGPCLYLLITWVSIAMLVKSQTSQSLYKNLFLLANTFLGMKCFSEKTETRNPEQILNMSQTSVITYRGPLRKCSHVCLWVIRIFIESGFIDDGESGGASVHCSVVYLHALVNLYTGFVDLFHYAGLQNDIWVTL